MAVQERQMTLFVTTEGAEFEDKAEAEAAEARHTQAGNVDHYITHNMQDSTERFITQIRNHLLAYEAHKARVVFGNVTDIHPDE